jgi:ABC-type multidrug transport system fused ATPase/permease subunit
MGGVVEESLSSIKLVTSFNQEKREVDKFLALAEKTRLVVQKAEKLQGLMYGFFMFFMFMFYVYAFWVGSAMIADKWVNPVTGLVYDAGSILTILMGIMMGMMLLMSLTPSIQAIVKAKVVGARVFEVIDR